MNYKTASIDRMIRQALSICSTYASLVTEFDEIRRIGQANDCPASFIFFFWKQGFYLIKQSWTSIIETPDYCLMSLQVFWGKFVFCVFCVLNGG
jgi:hypothetical protein